MTGSILSVSHLRSVSQPRNRDNPPREYPSSPYPSWIPTRPYPIAPSFFFHVRALLIQSARRHKSASTTGYHLLTQKFSLLVISQLRTSPTPLPLSVPSRPPVLRRHFRRRTQSSCNTL